MKLQMKTAERTGKRESVTLERVTENVTDVDTVILLFSISSYFKALCYINPRIPAAQSHVFQLPGPLTEPRPVQIDWVIPVCQRHSEGLPEDTST